MLQGFFYNLSLEVTARNRDPLQTLDGGRSNHLRKPQRYGPIPARHVMLMHSFMSRLPPQMPPLRRAAGFSRAGIRSKQPSE